MNSHPDLIMGLHVPHWDISSASDQHDPLHKNKQVKHFLNIFFSYTQDIRGSNEATVELVSSFEGLGWPFVSADYMGNYAGKRGRKEIKSKVSMWLVTVYHTAPLSHLAVPYAAPAQTLVGRVQRI